MIKLKVGQLVKPKPAKRGGCWSFETRYHMTVERLIDDDEIGLIVNVASQIAVNQLGLVGRDRQAFLVLFGEKIEMLFSEALQVI